MKVSAAAALLGAVGSVLVRQGEAQCVTTTCENLFNQTLANENSPVNCANVQAQLNVVHECLVEDAECTIADNAANCQTIVDSYPQCENLSCDAVLTEEPAFFDDGNCTEADFLVLRNGECSSGWTFFESGGSSTNAECTSSLIFYIAAFACTTEIKPSCNTTAINECGVVSAATGIDQCSPDIFTCDIDSLFDGNGAASISIPAMAASLMAIFLFN